MDKFCINCAHIVDATKSGFEKCGRKSVAVSPVTGIPVFHYCDTARRAGECGTEGKFFTPRVEQVAA
jgi:hypothetical protein